MNAWTTVRYGDCEQCGPAIEVKSNGLLYCTGCKLFVAGQVRPTGEPASYSWESVTVTNIRKLDIPTHERQRTGQCSAKCRSGKRQCDCRCGGRCHGAGDACYCGG